MEIRGRQELICSIEIFFEPEHNVIFHIISEMLADGGVAGLYPPHDLLLHPPAPGRGVQPPPVLGQGSGLGSAVNY